MEGKWHPSPFSGLNPHLHDEASGVYAWLTDPPGMLVRYHPGTYLGSSGAFFITNEVDQLMRARFAGVRKFLFLHDFSVAAGYESEARKILTSYALRNRHLVQAVACVPPPMNAMFRMGIETAALAMRVVGIHFEIMDDLPSMLERYHVRAAT